MIVAEFIRTFYPRPVAFDYGSTLRESDGIPALRDHVRLLNEIGVPVVVISAISEGFPADIMEAEIRSLTDSAGQKLEFFAVHFVRYPDPPTKDDIYSAGLAKASVMELYGAILLFDDSVEICQAVKSKGLNVVRVSRP